MPKMKTKKSAKKRFRVTKNGKVLGARAGRRHLLSVKTGKRRRQMRKNLKCSSYDAFRVRRLLVQG